MEEIVFEDVSYKGEPGNLTVNDKVFHYQADSTKTSVKCSWARVEKRQLSPESAKTHMVKLILVSGKSAVFTVRDRETLEELRNDMQNRMEAAKARCADPNRASFRTKSMRMSEDDLDRLDQSRKSVKWQDEPVRRGSVNNNKSRITSVRETRSYREEPKERDDDPCGCFFGTLMCWLFCCCICLLVAIAAFLVYWFALKDEDFLEAVGIDDSPIKNKDLPPDEGHEDRYGIRAVNHEWNSEEVTLKYMLSDYILDDSINFIVYDGLGCRTDANDITRSNQYIFIDWRLPKNDGGPDLNNKGTGSRGPYELYFTLNKGQIQDAPFYTQVGLETAQLNFCIGLSIDYNKVDYWSREQEVNAVETAIQINVDTSDFKRIDTLAIKTIVRPRYNRLRARP